jgi:cysteine desulfurase/selenocysteine lyase
MVMDYSHLREDFPTLRQEDAPAYLDNACVTLKPDSVIKSISDYYSMYPGCGGRSVHRYGTQVSRLVANSRRVMADFINAKSINEVVLAAILPIRLIRLLRV